MSIVRFSSGAAGRALGLMTLRSATIAAKFGLTLFIARYIGLADLGVYGIVVSVTAIAPIVFGFGVANNLCREAVKRGPAAIAPAILQYFVVLVPIYCVLFAGALVVWPERAMLILLVLSLLLAEHLLSDMYAIMTVIGQGYAANVIYFVRYAAWSVPYIPLAWLDPEFRTLTAIVVLWLVGALVACVLTVLMTRRWRWLDALRSLSRAPLMLPHKHGSTALYAADVANVLFLYLDRYIVGLFLTPTLLGVYVLYWTITNALNNLITIAVVQVERGALVRTAHLAARSFKQALGKVCVTTGSLALCLGLAASLMMYWVVPHLGRPAAVAYLPLMLALTAGLILRTVYEVMGISFYAYGRDDLVLYSGVAILVLALVLNVVLDPMIGIWGAALTVVVSYAAGAVIRGWVTLRGFRFAPGHGPPSVSSRRPAELAPEVNLGG